MESQRFRHTKRLLIGCASILVLATAHPSQAQKPGAKAAAWQVMERGLQSKNPIIRSKAVRLLGSIPSDPKPLALAEAAIDDRDSIVRTAAANAIGHIGTKESIPHLKAMLDDRSLKVVLAAAQALIQLKNPEPAYQVYYTVLMGERKNHDGVIRSQIQEEMLVLHDPRQLAQMGFEEGIGFVPYGGIGYEAIKRLTKNDASPVRAAAATMLINDKSDPRVSQALIDAAFDKSWIVRAAALDALGRRDDPSVLKPISAELTDVNAVVRFTAAAAVIRLSNDAAKQTQN